MLDNLLRCKGAIRLREIREVILDETCVSCKKNGQREADAQSTMQKASDTASKVAASIAGNLHDHEIVEIRLADDRKIRFEVGSMRLMLFCMLGRAVGASLIDALSALGDADGGCPRMG